MFVDWLDVSWIGWYRFSAGFVIAWWLMFACLCCVFWATCVVGCWVVDLLF